MTIRPSRPPLPECRYYEPERTRRRLPRLGPEGVDLAAGRPLPPVWSTTSSPAPSWHRARRLSSRDDRDKPAWRGLRGPGVVRRSVQNSGMSSLSDRRVSQYSFPRRARRRPMTRLSTSAAQILRRENFHPELTLGDAACC